MQRFLHPLTLLATACSLCAPAAGAFDFESDGIFFNITSDSTCEVTFPDADATPYAGDIVIPASVSHDGLSLSVTAIGVRAFAQTDKVTAISIPRSVTSIGAGAFDYCTRLTTLRIESLESWLATKLAASSSSPFAYTQYQTGSRNLFIGGEATSDITIPESVESISPYTFFGFRLGGTLTLGDNVRTIGTQAFAYSYFRTLRIGASLQSVAAGAFAQWSNSEVHVGSLSQWCRISFTAEMQGFTPLTSSPLCQQSADAYNMRHLFVNGEKITEVVIPDDVTEVTGSFAGYQALESVVIPDHVSALPSGFCSFCENLTSTSIGNGIAEVPPYAFFQNKKLASLHLGDNITKIDDSAFTSCYLLPLPEFPSSLRTIARQAFTHCRTFTDLVFPESLTSVGDAAFAFCSGLQSVSIPESVENIGFAAFYPADVIRTVRSYRNVPPVMSTTQQPFSPTVYANATLSVPNGSRTAYMEAPGWKNFTNIEESLPTGAVEVPAAATEVTVSTDGLTIRFHNLQPGTVYTITDPAGRTVITGTEPTATLGAHGIYIIRTENRTMKIAL